MLENTKYRLTKAKKLTVGYFGASITEGFGASCPEKNWAGRCTAWLRETYPECELKTVQASIGGTGSLFGVYRCDTNLIAHHPDLVFFEFATNDSADEGDNIASICNNCESVFRKIYADNPSADIVVVFTATRATSDCLNGGNTYVGRTAHSAVARYYRDIPEIDIGEVLRTRILSEGSEWSKYTVDNCHPNDDGYKVYGDAVIAHLSRILEDAEEQSGLVSKVLPEPIFGADSRVHAHMTDAWEVTDSEGFERVDKPLKTRYPHYFEATKPGARLSYRFYGTRIEIFWMMAKDSGDVFVSIDDGPEKFVSSWDSYCKNFNRGCMTPLFHNLPEGEHVLHLRVADTKAEESEGYAIRIGTFCIV